MIFNVCKIYMIPKIIHQTWKTHDVPKNWEQSVESCRTVYKDYKYILWTDTDMDQFVKTHFAWFYPTWIKYPYMIQRCDSFRYMVIYIYGGVYIDLDIGCKKQPKELLNKYDLVLAKSVNSESTLTNAFIASVPKNRFILYCIQNLNAYINHYGLLGKHLHVMNSTGPLFLNNMLYSYPYNENMYILTHREYVFDCTVCNSKCNGGEYFFEAKGNSWHAFDSRLYNHLRCVYHFDRYTVLYAIILIVMYMFLHIQI